MFAAYYRIAKDVIKPIMTSVDGEGFCSIMGALPDVVSACNHLIIQQVEDAILHNDCVDYAASDVVIVDLETRKEVPLLVDAFSIEPRI